MCQICFVHCEGRPDDFGQALGRLGTFGFGPQTLRNSHSVRSTCTQVLGEKPEDSTIPFVMFAPLFLPGSQSECGTVRHLTVVRSLLAPAWRVVLFRGPSPQKNRQVSPCLTFPFSFPLFWRLMDKHLQDLRHIDIEHHYIRCNEVSLAFFLNSEDQVVRFYVTWIIERSRAKPRSVCDGGRSGDILLPAC